METILIDNDKIKVILTSEDMKSMNITVQDLNYSTPETKYTFWGIMKKIYAETGFRVDNHKLYVQVYPSKDGGCEMFIIKINNTHEKKEIKTIESKEITTVNGFFIILDFNSLYMLSQRINEEKIKLETTLYHDLENTYLLTVIENKHHPAYCTKFEKNIKIPIFLSEYGKVYPLNEDTLCRIKERCKILIEENAVEKIASI